MKISELIYFCQQLEHQFGDLEVGIFTEGKSDADFTCNHAMPELLEIRTSVFNEKTKLILGLGFGADFYEKDRQKIMAKPKNHLRVVR